MARISDLAATSNPLMSDVTIVSNGELTYKVTLQDLKTKLVPRATGSDSGTIKVGSGLTINDAGVLSVSDYRAYSLPRATTTTLGGVKIGEGIAVDSFGTISVQYSPPTASRYNFGIVKVGNGIEVNEGVISVVQSEISGSFSDSGITIGTSSTASFKIMNGSFPSLSADDFGVLDFSIKDGSYISSIKFISKEMSMARSNVNKPALIPDLINATLGLPTAPWDAVYATTLHGDIDGIASRADSLLISGQYVPASASAVVNTIPVRDTTGAITAAKFVGIADKADKLKSNNDYYFTDTNAAPYTIPVRDINGDIKAARFVGISDKTDKTKLDTTYVTAATASTPNTIAGRDGDGNITANIFNGTAVAARYADLAEKYIPDRKYNVGTVLVFGGAEEVTSTSTFSDYRVAGVVSESPAYLMNQDSSGIAVALRGKVPVNVIGLVNKGDLLVTSAIDGYAISVGKDRSHGIAIFAKSLENKTIHDRGTVMAVIL